MTGSPDRRRLAKGLRLAARIIGGAVVAFFLMFLIGDAVISIQEEGFQGITLESLFVVVPAVIVLAGYIVSWWREGVGGSLLVVAYFVFALAPSVHAIFYGERFQIFPGMLLFPIPILVAGILFLIARQFSKS